MRPRNGLLGILGRLVVRGAWLLAVAVIVHLTLPGHRPARSATPFNGDRWYNPYDDLDPDRRKLRASFHSHGRAWGGLSYGENTDEELYARYQGLGYDVIGISNYMKIRPAYPDEQAYFTCYEHGYSAGGQHQTVIGAPNVNWLDVPIAATRRHKQFVLDHLREDAELLIINHPNKKESYTLDDMRALHGYHGVEIRTRFAKGVSHWDAALSAGRPVWGFCADDCHGTDAEVHVAAGWVEVDAEPNSSSVLEALRAGRFLNVWAKHHFGANHLVRHEIVDGKLELELARGADMVRFIGQDGEVRGWHARVQRASYELQPDDTYIRVEFNTRGSFRYTNPIFRYENDPFAAHFAPTETATATLGIRAVGGVLAVLFLLGSFPGLRARLRQRPARKTT